MGDYGGAMEFPPGGEDSARGGSAQGREEAYLSNKIPKPDFSQETNGRENGHYVVAL